AAHAHRSNDDQARRANSVGVGRDNASGGRGFAAINATFCDNAVEPVEFRTLCESYTARSNTICMRANAPDAGSRSSKSRQVTILLSPHDRPSSPNSSGAYNCHSKTSGAVGGG